MRYEGLLRFGDAAASFFLIKPKFVIANITACGEAAVVSTNRIA
jgi:hypothetical protein